MRENDIAYTNLYFSLGIFGIFLSFIFLLVLIYLIINLLSTRINCCLKKRNYLRRKLLYNVWIRYILESNLKMTHTCIFFLAISGGFATVDQNIRTWIRITILTFYLLWPIFMILFLYRHRNELDKQSFMNKFKAMYSGIKTKKLTAYTYNSIFCIRRFLLVITLYLL